METKINFPPFCCFGRLQDDSVTENAEETSASYKMFNAVVHKLINFKERGAWRIEDYSPEGKRLRLSNGSTLEKAVCIHMLYLKNETDYLFNALKGRFSEFENIDFEPFAEMGGNPNMAHSPAGKLLLVRSLMKFGSIGNDFRNQMKLILTLPLMIGPDNSFELTLINFYETAYFSMKEDHIISENTVYVAEFLIPLAFVYDTVKWLKTNLIIGKDESDRIIIQDSSIVGENIINTGYNGLSRTTTVCLLRGFMVNEEVFKSRLKEFVTKIKANS